MIIRVLSPESVASCVNIPFKVVSDGSTKVKKMKILLNTVT